MSGQGLQQLTLFQEDSRASHTALSAPKRGQKMNGIYGPSLCGLSKNSDRVGLLEKMLLGYYRQYMSQYVPTWKQKATKSGRTVYRLSLSGHRTKDTGLQLLASPRASQEYKPIRAQTPKEREGKHGNALCANLGVICPERIGQHINPQFVEWMMGYPADWTLVLKNE